MLKITLPNGVIIESDSPVEVSKTIHSIYWRQFSQKKSEAVIIKNGGNIKGFCKICRKPLIKGDHRHIICDSAECKKRLAKIHSREWYIRHRDKLKNKTVQTEIPPNSPIVPIIHTN